MKDEWSSVARSVGAKLGDWECHAAGCFSNVSAANEGKAETMNEVVTRLPSFHEWPGSKLRTGIESADGGVEYSWFLFAADETAAGQPSRGDGT
ncbi:MAG TPA: hypothetical protein VJT73_02160 [Polyangiaceae bacterium]|nr:hypothetical protein [Polyangiaceae bacterium]